MPSALIQFTQGATVGPNGQSMLGFVANQTVTMTDAGGSGASAYEWTMMSWPSPLSSAPTIINGTTQVATTFPTLDGSYIVQLKRTEGAVVTYDYKFFAVVDDDGLSLPSAGQSGRMTNISTDAQNGGWAGRLSAGTNAQLDAYLRLLKARVGRYEGHVQAFAHSGTTSTGTLTDGVSKPYRVVTLAAASGDRIEELALPALGDGKKFSFLVALTATSGNYIIHNGVSGTTLLTLTPPPSGTLSYNVVVVNTGSNWVISQLTLVDPLAIHKREVIEISAGVQSTDQILPTRIGSCKFDPAKFPASVQVKFQAEIEATAGKTVQIQLYNLTDGAFVGTPLTSSLNVPTTVEQVVTLPGSSKVYEAMLNMTVAGTPLDRVTCTSSRLIPTWG